MTTVNGRTNSAKKFLLSMIVFILNYYFLFGFIILSVYLNDPIGYEEFVHTHIPSLAYMFVCILLVFVIMYLYYLFENRELFSQLRNVQLIFTVYNICIIISYFMGRYVDIYARPVALVALLMLLLRNRKEAIFMNMVYSITMFVIDSFTNFNGVGANNSIYSSFMMAFAGGMVAIFIASRIKTRFTMILAGFVITIPIEIIVGMFSVTEFSGIGKSQIIEALGYGLIGGMSSTIFLLALLPIYEVLFSCLTVFRLRELTSLDVKLLKELKEKAPGSFNHSTVVAQLAENCAANLGENPELARAAAYYHDVGKLCNPEYFTENQQGKNPHDDIAPEVSINIIRSHTKKGYELILKNHLPKFFAEVALRHHGTMPIKYFYVKAMKMTDGAVNISDYSYQNSKPLDKITAIIMIADASEAATRSLPRKSEDQIEAVVRSIIEERIDLDQFSECDITMKELTEIKTTIVNSLSGVYHHRVNYPDIKVNRSSLNK